MPTEVQFYAYEIDTHDTSCINASLARRGINPNEMSQEHYLHQQANLQVALIKQHVLPNLQARPEVVPIFIAPEFFFKWRDGTPYDRATFFNGIDYLTALSGAFPAVVWVLGTIWWHEPHGSTGMSMVHNSALVLHGGKLVHSWQKERLSSIDGLQDAETWDRWDAQAERILEQTQTPFFTPPGHHGLSCAVEVCLDHLTLATTHGPEFGVVRSQYPVAHPRGRGVDLHLLTAAGMPLQPENIAARHGGVMVRCDGGQGQRPRSQCFQVLRDGRLQDWNPALMPVTVIRHGDDADECLAVYDAILV